MEQIDLAKEKSKANLKLIGLIALAVKNDPARYKSQRMIIKQWIDSFRLA